MTIIINSTEFEKIVARYKNGEPVIRLAEEYGVAKNTLWSRFKSHGVRLQYPKSKPIHGQLPTKFCELCDIRMHKHGNETPSHFVRRRRFCSRECALKYVTRLPKTQKWRDVNKSAGIARRGKYIPWNRGKTVPLLSEIQRGEKNHMYGRRGVLNPCFGRKGHPAWNKGKSGYLSIEARNNIRSARLGRKLPIRDTSIEIKMKEALEKEGIVFAAQYNLHEKFLMDFAIPQLKIGIECDGVYWHSLPRNRSYDIRKNNYCKIVGWTLLRFTDREINHSISECMRTIKDLIQVRTAAMSATDLIAARNFLEDRYKPEGWVKQHGDRLDLDRVYESIEYARRKLSG